MGITLARELEEQTSSSSVEVAVTAVRAPPHGHDRPQIGRFLIYFHHIQSPVKKKYIVEWADQLDLGGCWTDGYPGLICAEGPLPHLLEYVTLLQRLHWKFMTVRGEQVELISV